MELQSFTARWKVMLRNPWTKYIAIILFLAPPWVINNAYYVHVLNMIGIYFILTVSLDLVLGTTGLLQLGHAGFYGFGAYVGALISTVLLPNTWAGFWIGLPVVILLTMAVGFLVGVPTLRLRGIYFALATLAFGEIMRELFLNWQSVTNGPFGMRAIPSPHIASRDLGGPTGSYYLIYVFCILTVWVVYSLRKSRFGRFWRAIREDETGASTMGINIFSMKIWALMISAGIAGAAGSLFAHYISYINPSNFTMDDSILILSMAIIGGRDKLMGAFIGSAALIMMPEMLRSVAEYRLLIYGIIVTIMIVFRPEGVMGKT